MNSDLNFQEIDDYMKTRKFSSRTQEAETLRPNYSESASVLTLLGIHTKFIFFLSSKANSKIANIIFDFYFILNVDVSRGNPV